MRADRAIVAALVHCVGLLVAAAAQDPSTAGASPSISPPAGARVVNLLPSGPLSLYPHDFDSGNSSAECTAAQVLRANYSGAALPQASPESSLFVSALVSCGTGTGGGRAAPRLQPGVLFGAGRLAVSVDCARGLLVLSGSDRALGAVQYALPQSQLLSLGLLSLAGAGAAGGDVRLDVTVSRGGGGGGAPRAAAVCINGQPARPAGLQLPARPLLDYLAAADDLLAWGVSFGAWAEGQRSARADLSHAWAADYTPPCAPREALLPGLEAAAAGNAAPALASLTRSPAGDVFAGDSVEVTAAATDSDGDALRLSLTFFGLPPPGCAAAECGDQQVAAAGTAPGAAVLTAAATYAKPGRYVVRAAASDARGGVATADLAVLVRRVGDIGGRAPCCRHTPGVTAGQLGRPVHESVYRAPSVYRHGQALGWSREYLDNEDLEAERLFDFGALAPPVPPTPLASVSCLASRLAGAGSPELPGSTPGGRATTQGHNKKLVLIPEGFDWVTSKDEVSCQQHWSGWERGSPHTLPDAGSASGVCSTTCTKAGTELLMQQTAMFDQYNEALIAASYGALSLSPAVAVLPEILIPRNTTPAGDNYEYYEAPARAALAAQGLQHWMYLVLVPQAAHRAPNFRAWSGGETARGSTITECYATYYYAVHETGHRMGFHHANMYRLEEGSTAPADPLGPGTITTDGYSASLDAMACCKSDYGLYDRLMAGWLAGAGERQVVAAPQLAAPGTRRLQLWPFDRPESRGNLMALSLRRSDGEALLLGFRSAAHWQDVRVAPNGGPGPLAPEESRHNVEGLAVEYVRREGGTWDGHGLLDFNVLTGDWPGALPAAGNQFPRTSQFALLREGYSWHDAASKTLVAVESIGPCAGAPGLPLHNHSAPNFYGFRGEYPFAEFYERADYTGYAGLDCLNLVLTTGVTAPPLAKLPLSLELVDSGGAGGGSSCGAPLQPEVALRLPEGVAIASITWRDNLNRTLPALRGRAAVALPPLRPVAESASDPGFGCAGALCPGQTYSVQVLAADGRHSRAEVTLTSLGLRGVRATVRYKFYLQRSVEQAREELSLRYTWPPAAEGPAAPAGVALHSSSQPPLQLAAAGGGGGRLTAAAPVDAACSKQWTLSVGLRLNTPAAEGVIWSVDGGYPALSIGPGVASWRALWLQWGSYVRKVELRDTAARQLTLVATRDGGRLGLFVNGAGGWAMPDLACIPSRDAITHCDHAPVPAEFRSPGTIRFGSEAAANGSGAVDGSLAFVRMYNYAIPAADILGEVDIADGAAAWYRLSDSGSALLGQSSSGGGSGAAAVIIACSVAAAAVTAVGLVSVFLVLRRKRRVAAAAAADKQQCPSPTPGSDCSSDGGKCCDSPA